MGWTEALLLAAAGLGAGLAGSVAGLASLVSYPALLAVGLPPVVANVTNTVALVGGGVGAVAGSRPELRGHRAGRLWRLCVAAGVGGAAGAALLLTTPAEVFERLVPVLLGAAALVILVRPRPRAGPRTRDPRLLAPAVALVSVYGGYFGAAAGVVLLAVVLPMTGESLPRGNAVKNLVLGVANAVAAVAFVAFGPVRWAAVLPLALGFLAGGRLGPAVVRRVPAGVLRTGIGVAGLVLAVRLGLDAYS